MEKPNVIISGLTAAGKTTHARLLASELSYRYISATEIIADMIGVDRREVGPGFWERHGDAIGRVRDETDLDRQLDQRLVEMATIDEGLVIDAWALPWLVASPYCISMWIESDHYSRSLKAAVSDENQHPLPWYEAFISRKDDDARDRFLAIYGFDIYGPRQRFDIDLDNSAYITEATRANADYGIVRFGPLVSAAVATQLISAASIRIE